MASIISGAADFKVIPLDSECLLLVEGRPSRSCYGGLLWALSGPWRFDSEGQLSR